MLKPLTDLTTEAKDAEEAMLTVRRQIWRGETVASRDLIDPGMRAADFLCKLSSRADKERNHDAIAWLQQTRRSMRAMLREYWMDVLDQRRALYAPEVELGVEAFTIPVR